VRQAIALCLDRQTIAEQLFGEAAQTLDTYVPPGHPLYAATARHYGYDPEAASALLEKVGWKDLDGDPATPRQAYGVPGVAEGTPFEFTYLLPSDSEREQAARLVQAFLAGCGIKANLKADDAAQLFAPGPEGPVFGRHFEMVQFAWPTALQPPCTLYTTDEIPGPYPDFPKGWGGANATGYSNPQFDQACWQARFSLPDSPEYLRAHQQAQEIFAEDLPAIPLYAHLDLAAARPDLCGVLSPAYADTPLWNLETWDQAEDCAGK
jgi:peptide/nickel transport system substrate-binding protein